MGKTTPDRAAAGAHSDPGAHHTPAAPDSSRTRWFPRRARQFLDVYTKDLTTADLQRLFTHETPEAYRFFTRGPEFVTLSRLPLHRRLLAHIRLFLLAFSSRLPPPRRVLFGVAFFCALVGLLQLFQGFHGLRLPLGPMLWLPIPVPSFVPGAGWLLLALALTNLLVMLEVADRLSLKRDLEIARDIQEAMLPRGTYVQPGCEVFGVTRPANTVGGDFYDIIPLTDGRVALAVGDVAGKGSPAALLMALVIAMLRTLLEEGLPPAELVSRLNLQVLRRAPASRFITLFYAVFDPLTGEVAYVNAGHTRPLVRRGGGTERLAGGDMALGFFDGSKYRVQQTRLRPGEELIAYSDGVTEAEDPHGEPFEEAGLERVIAAHPASSPAQLAGHVLQAVEEHVGDHRFADDLTLLVLSHRAVAPGPCP